MGERRFPRPATRAESVATLSMALVVVAAYVVLAMLDPDPRGHGTHEQLGMTACSWPGAYGIPCPTCGVTTAAVLLLHVHPVAAFATQPFGMLLTLAGAAFVVLGVRHALRGESLFARLAYWPWGWIGLGALAVLLVSWGWVAATFG